LKLPPPPVEVRMQHGHEWAVILAGGNGTRIQTLTRLVAGDERPKQFCRLVGNDTLLAATRARLSTTVAPERTLCVVTSQHEPFYRHEFSSEDWSRVVEQPVNRGTGIAIAYGLACVTVQVPDAVVGFFPADHHYDDGDALRQTLDDAYRAAALDRDRVFLIGAEPDRAEVEYGWIARGDSLGPASAGARGISNVAGFVEKPSAAEADLLLRRGCLWNTFVLVGHAEAFRVLLDRALPGLYAELVAILNLPDPPRTTALERLYASPIASDFSRDVLSRYPERLGVIELARSGWTDLGQPARALRVMARCGMPTPDAVRIAI
jgi:mannose-1-phosphate guanylyltransferase